MRALSVITLSLLIFTNCNSPMIEEQKSNITQITIEETIAQLKSNHPQSEHLRIEKGVNHSASLWWPQDGSEQDFIDFCINKFIADHDQLHQFFNQISIHWETLNGNFNKMALELQKPIHLKHGEIQPIDAMFAGYNAGAHLINDLFDNKIAFYIALNFPYYSLKEKEEAGHNLSRKNWAYMRVGDIFTSRIPASILQNYARVSAESELYISQYNIYAGQLINETGQTLFPKDMMLLSHWGLRDELKANYPNGQEGLAKQNLIYEVMNHIIHQTIPEKVINNSEVIWAPYNNAVLKNENRISTQAEPDTRYQQIIDNFNALRQMDAYTPLNTYIRRNFEEGMEIDQPTVEALFVEFLSSEVLAEVGSYISKRLERPLKPFDIWYDGFKSRSNINEDVLTNKTSALYPDAESFEKDIPNILVKLGYDKNRANYLADKITVEPARGSGHAWGAAMKGMKSYLRTRIPDEGMDYKGFNIAMHELGHNVEQTISFYDVDYYMLNGVPNTAFTEALAFIFQKRDLALLGINESDKNQQAYKTLDLIWATYEIMGVSLLDMRVWKWLYENPQANASQVKTAVINMSIDIWNQFYAPVYGVKDQPILAIYSHMISYPLYLSAYAYGNIIESQLEEHLINNDFANEVDRIFMIGKLTPNHWMQQAVGADIDIKPLINSGKNALQLLN